MKIHMKMLFPNAIVCLLLICNLSYFFCNNDENHNNIELAASLDHMTNHESDNNDELLLLLEYYQELKLVPETITANNMMIRSRSLDRKRIDVKQKLNIKSAAMMTCEVCKNKRKLVNTMDLMKKWVSFIDDNDKIDIIQKFNETASLAFAESDNAVSSYQSALTEDQDDAIRPLVQVYKNTRKRMLTRLSPVNSKTGGQTILFIQIFALVIFWSSFLIPLLIQDYFDPDSDGIINGPIQFTPLVILGAVVIAIPLTIIMIIILVPLLLISFLINIISPSSRALLLSSDDENVVIELEERLLDIKCHLESLKCKLTNLMSDV